MKNRFFLCMLIALCNINVQAQNNEASIGTMYFSNQPFTVSHDNSKTSFSSSEFIYGRLELTGGSVKDVFKVKEDKDKDPLSLYYEATVYHNGKQRADANFWKYCLLKEDDQNKTWLNFDVLPEPSKATTVLTGSPGFRDGLASAPLNLLFDKEHFPESGQYTIKIEFYKETYDAWGNKESMDKWVSTEREFNFTFNVSDIATLTKNAEEANSVAGANAFRYSQLPDVFSHSAAIRDPEVTNAKIMAILKRDLPQRTALKIAIDYKGGDLWFVEKNDLGIPIQKKFWPTMHVAYKRDDKCYVGTVELVEQYQGGGHYAPLKVGYTSERDRGIDCGKVK